MRENKKGVPTVAAVENAEKQTLNHSVGVQAATDNIPFLEPHLKHIMELLPLGQANAVSMYDLSNLLNITDREVRKVIFDLRCKGMVIAGDNNGYYIPNGLNELKAYYKLALSRGKATIRSIKAAKREIERLEGAAVEN